MLKPQQLYFPLLALWLGCSTLIPATPGWSGAPGDGVTNRAGFIDWLLGRGNRSAERRPPGAGDPPAGSRGEFCIVSPALGSQSHQIFHTQPTFIFDGATSGLTVVAQGHTEPLWRAPANTGLSTVRYNGAPLEPGETYELQVYNPRFPDSVLYKIAFQVMEAPVQAEVQQALEILELTAVETGQTVETLIQQRADYFWAEGLEMDAWREIANLATASPATAEALQNAVEQMCSD